MASVWFIYWGCTQILFVDLLYLCRFHEHWRFVLQRLVFLAAFVVYLETETLVTREAVTEILGSKCLHVICRVLYISLGFRVGGLSLCL